MSELSAQNTRSTKIKSGTYNKLWDTTRWRFMKSNVLFGGYNRIELNRLAKKWGVKKYNDYKNKNDLTKFMHMLMYTKYGDVGKRKSLNNIATGLSLNPNSYKNKML